MEEGRGYRGRFFIPSGFIINYIIVLAGIVYYTIGVFGCQSVSS